MSSEEYKVLHQHFIKSINYANGATESSVKLHNRVRGPENGNFYFFY